MCEAVFFRVNISRSYMCSFHLQNGKSGQKNQVLRRREPIQLSRGGRHLFYRWLHFTGRRVGLCWSIQGEWYISNQQQGRCVFLVSSLFNHKHKCVNSWPTISQNGRNRCSRFPGWRSVKSFTAYVPRRVYYSFSRVYYHSHVDLWIRNLHSVMHIYFSIFVLTFQTIRWWHRCYYHCPDFINHWRNLHLLRIPPLVA